MTTQAKFTKKTQPTKSYEQQQSRRVQTEAIDSDDQFDIQTAIMKFKNLQDIPNKKSKPTSITKQMNVIKQSQQQPIIKENNNSQIFIGKKENNNNNFNHNINIINNSQNRKQITQTSQPASKSPNAVTLHLGLQNRQANHNNNNNNYNNLNLTQTNILEVSSLQQRNDSRAKYAINKISNTQSLLVPFQKIEDDYSNYTYTNLKVIGSGSFGVVYKSKVNETGEIIAIKKVLQDKRYKNRELQILQELNHPNVLKLKHAFFTQSEESDDSYLHVVMEYYAETLYSYNRSFIKQKQFMPDILVKLYSYQLLRSIGYFLIIVKQQFQSYISIKDICHRDIKPHNILVNPQTNRLILCDFGSAKRLVQGEPNIAYICSRCYRAPELIFGATDYSPQIDVWSTGCVIAEMFNGEPLFLGESAVDQLVEIIKILGTPNKEQVIQMNKNYDLNLYKFVQIKKRDWKKIMRPRMEALALDLVSKLLVYSPNIRLTPLQALSHPYFDELRDENNIKMMQIKKINIPDLFDFTRDEFGKEYNLASKLIPKWYQSKIKQQL